MKRPVPAGDDQTSDNGIAGRIARAASAQGVNQLARAVQLFLLVPICLSAWGTATYEDWVLLNSIAAFLALGDLGFGQLTTVKLIEVWSTGQQERFSLEWTRAIGWFIVVSIALLAGLGMLLVMPGWTAFVPTRALAKTDVAATAVLLCLATVSALWIYLVLGVYRARGDLGRSYHISTILVIFQTAGIAGPAVIGAGPMAAAMGNMIITGATFAAIIADLARRYPDLRWRPAFPTIDEFHRGARSAVGYLIAPATMTVMMNGPTLILANIGAPSGAIALFTASRTIAGVARQLPYQFAHPAGVELAGLMARNDRQGLSRVYERASRALAIVVGVLGGFVVVAAPLVMTLWTRGKIAYDRDLMLLLVGTTTICAPSQVAYTLLWYGGQPRLLNRALVFSTGLAMGLGLLLGLLLGVRGVAAGLGVGEIVGIALYLSVLVDHLLKRRAGGELLRNFWISSASLLGSAGGGYVICRLIEPRGWSGLVELGIGWTIAAAVGLYWALLSASQRAQLTDAALGAMPFWKARSRAS